METRNASRRYVLLTAVNCTGDGLRKNHRMLPLACRERISLSGRRYTAITTETHVGHTPSLPARAHAVRWLSTTNNGQQFPRMFSEVALPKYQREKAVVE